MTLQQYTFENFDEPEPPEAPALQKSILWPSVVQYVDHKKICGVAAFPNIRDIKTRYYNRFAAEPLSCFLDAIKEAQRCIWIVDPYLFEERNGFSQQRLDQILSWFSEPILAADIRLLTDKFSEEIQRSVFTQFEELKEVTTDAYEIPVNVQVKFSLSLFFPYIHDRFAIIDHELWHFGATVGGLHHQVSAVSRGWRADDYEAREFFELAWQGDQDFNYKTKRRKAND